MTVTVRFAPSPTGHLHVGNARTAVLNWLFARAEAGHMVLRFDDTDEARSTAEFAEAIIEDMLWLGLTHERIERQSMRIEPYETAVERLKHKGLLYACFETDAELERKRKRQLLKGMPPVYDREGMNLTDDQCAAFEREGRTPHWRFALEHETVSWNDLVRGEQSIDCASLSDPVLIRGDGSFLYTLPSVVDDIDFSISHVIRGEDHVSNTAVQIQLANALGATPPEFAHHGLLVAADGGRLSKRSGAQSVRDLREAGLEAMTVASFVATIGTSEPVAAHQRLEDLVGSFDLAKLSRAPARFDVEELQALNAKLLGVRDHEDVCGQLDRLEVGGGADFWSAVRGNCQHLTDALVWWQIATEEIEPVIERDEAEYCATAAELLPEEPWGEQTWREWTGAVSETSKRTGSLLFAPLRLALTGQARGPELAALLPFIGRERAHQRLSAGATR